MRRTITTLVIIGAAAVAAPAQASAPDVHARTAALRYHDANASWTWRYASTNCRTEGGWKFWHCNTRIRNTSGSRSMTVHTQVNRRTHATRVTGAVS